MGKNFETAESDGHFKYPEFLTKTLNFFLATSKNGNIKEKYILSIGK